MARRAKDTKQPSWGVVTFEQIEARRKELGLPKSAMANGLRITNSTYHNWARGTTVPHPIQQDQIKAALGTMTAESARTAPPKEKRARQIASKQKHKAGATKRQGRKPKSVPERTSRKRENVAGGSIPMPSGFTPTEQDSLADVSSVRGRDTASIATITAAYISSQSAKGEPVEQQMVFDFISGLQKALYPTNVPVTAAASVKAEEPAAATA